MRCYKSKIRKTISGRKLQDGPLKNVTICTKVPDKWVFVDTETGDVWGNPDGTKYRRASVEKTKDALEILKKHLGE